MSFCKIFYTFSILYFSFCLSHIAYSGGGRVTTKKIRPGEKPPGDTISIDGIKMPLKKAEAIGEGIKTGVAAGIGSSLSGGSTLNLNEIIHQPMAYAIQSIKKGNKFE